MLAEKFIFLSTMMLLFWYVPDYMYMQLLTDGEPDVHCKQMVQFHRHVYAPFTLGVRDLRKSMIKMLHLVYLLC